jgi:hypothetical protein
MINTENKGTIADTAMMPVITLRAALKNVRGDLSLFSRFGGAVGSGATG